MANNIQITYTPFFRDDILNNEINIPTPIIEIKGYTPKYNFSIQHEKELTPNEQHVSLNKETIPIVKQEKGLDQATNPYAKKTSNGKFKSRDEFKSIMSNVYKKLLKEKGINTEYAKALVAQDALESAYGTKLAGKFNYGGIKGKGTISKTREVINGKEIFINDSFKDFNSIEDYANYKIKLLSNKRYNAFSGNLKDFANKVHKGGYATDPNYTKVLNKMIASAKYGGILKYQEGGIAQSKN